ncbi:MAG: aminotransferase class I/II-fold pyridoxal phosphate-dependent enzyme, partial [Methanoregulaceae archaeon]
FAESFAIAALQKLGDLESSREYIRRERERLAAALTDLGFSVTPSSTNFLLADTHRNASVLRERLLSQGIMVRDCASFGLPESIRVAVLTREENTRLLEALSECLP